MTLLLPSLSNLLAPIAFVTLSVVAVFGFQAWCRLREI